MIRFHRSDVFYYQLLSSIQFYKEILNILITHVENRIQCCNKAKRAIEWFCSELKIQKIC